MYNVMYQVHSPFTPFPCGGEPSPPPLAEPATEVPLAAAEKEVEKDM